MKKIQLAENLFIYNLSDAINILVLQNNGKALLIDTGYPEQAQELKNALMADNLQPEIIITSHFHPDHINGNYIFSNCKFMGSELYKQNFELFESLNPTLTFIKPTTLLKNGQTFSYGSFNLKFLSLPGHCRDLMAIVINDEFIHAADLIMFNKEGKNTLPYISYDGNIDDHLKSLAALKEFSYTVIPSHGQVLNDTAQIQQAIEIRQYYLTRLKALGKSAKLEDCLMLPIDQYAFLGIHQTNLQNSF